MGVLCDVRSRAPASPPPSPSPTRGEGSAGLVAGVRRVRDFTHRCAMGMVLASTHPTLADKQISRRRSE